MATRPTPPETPVQMRKSLWARMRVAARKLGISGKAAVALACVEWLEREKSK